MKSNSYKVIDLNNYYRKGVYERFTKGAKCSVSITHKIDVTELIKYSRYTDSKFYINFLYLISKVLNSKDDYRMGYLWQTDTLVQYDTINPCHYIFHEDTETCTPVYSVYYPEYQQFYKECEKDIEKAKSTCEYGFDMINHPNWFDASFIPWISYESLNVELPDGHLYYQPIINWGKYKKEGDKYLMPISVRMNHAVADGYLISKVFLLLEEAINKFTKLSDIYLAGGCFWGTEHFMKQINGVKKTEVGYANGKTADPTYQDVCKNNTGHAETVKVCYNPEDISLMSILELYFMTIDPTSINKQGGDKGTQYRTGIYYTDNKDLSIIQSALDTLSKKYTQPIAIEVKSLENFYKAEDYHQDYLNKNEGGYCHIAPGLFEIARKFNRKSSFQNQAGIDCNNVQK